jgi:5-methylcytosine-specific restriction endonuclease McrA
MAALSQDADMAKGMNLAVALFMAQGAECFYCACEFEGRELPVKKRPRAWTKDHVRPASAGHKSVKNVVLACLTCNREKKNREPTPQELARAQKIWDSALRYFKAFNGQVPPSLTQV